ncbi:MAG: C40 family peptidase [Armatimonadetes bacterium]|nr:C40 family peptidase [Armatimonadota bacterium]
MTALTLAYSALSGAPAVPDVPYTLLDGRPALIASIAPEPEPRKHKVLKNENDWKIARKYGITVSQLHAVNPGIQWRRLQIGQKINLPPGAGTADGRTSIRTSRARVASAKARIRSEPNTSSRIKATVSSGTIAGVIQRDGNWYKLRFPRGTVGWVRGDLLAEVADPITPPAPMPDSDGSLAPVNLDKSSSIVNLALDMRGVRYRWGGTTPRGFDCSGLVVYAYRKQGIVLPRTSAVLATFGQHVSKDRLQPGDLLFFKTGRSRRVNHVALYIGDDKFVHSSSSRGKVVVTRLTGYGARYAGARRMPGLQLDAEVVLPDLEPEKVERVRSRVVIGTDTIGK